MNEKLLCELDLPISNDTLASAGRLRKRALELDREAFSLYRCTAADIPALQDLIASVNWQVAPADMQVILEHGELWALRCGNQLISSAGWIGRGGGIAWIVLVTTRPEWRGCSAATLMMHKVLETSKHCLKRLLDASDMGESVYRRMGFVECAQVHFYEFMPENSAFPPARYPWQKMLPVHFDLPGSFADDPTLRIMYERSPELCQVLIINNRIAAWFIGREKSAHIHVGPIYAVETNMAFDALCYMRQMHPERKLTADVFTDEDELIRSLQVAGGTYHHRHCRMYYAQNRVLPALSNVRSSSGPDFG